MTITNNVIKEKVRRKDLYIIAAVSILITLLFSSGNSVISVEGVPITDFPMLLPVMLTVITALGCILAAVLSLSTIPNEYKRCTSHLIWTRGVPQARYHIELAAGSVISSLIGLLLLYSGAVIFCFAKGEAACILRLPIAYIFSAVPVCVVSVFASALSVKLPVMAAGLLSAAFIGAGFLRGILLTMLNVMSEGAIGGILRRVVGLIPDLYRIQAAGAGYVTGAGEADIHAVLGGLSAFYILTLPVLLLRRKEA